MSAGLLRNSSCAFLVLLTLFLSSCQQEVDFPNPNNPNPNPNPTPPTVKVIDSTQLIKSITQLSYDAISGMMEDSIVEYYNYDSANRKLQLRWEGDGNDYGFPNGTTAEISYNEKKFVSNVVYQYPATAAVDTFYHTAAEYYYDAANVLEKTVVSFYGGRKITCLYTKTPVATGGYTLSWKEPFEYSTDGFHRKATFNAAGKYVAGVREYTYVAVANGNGNDVFSKKITNEAITYDASGNIDKISETIFDSLYHTTETFTYFESLSRETKGNQLYLQRQAILNGIANIPFGDEFQIPGTLGVLCTYHGIEDQYSAFPIKSVRVYDNYNRAYTVFNTTPVLDNKDRLVKFRGFFDDVDLHPLEYRISYYK